MAILDALQYGSWSPGWKIRWTVRETSESAYGKVTSLSKRSDKNRKSSKTEVRQIIIASPNSNRTQTLVVFFFIVAAFFFVYFIHSQYHFFYSLESAEHKQSNSLVGTLYHVDRQKRFILVKPNAPCGLVIWVSKPTWVLPRILYCSKNLERRKAKTPPRAFE